MKKQRINVLLLATIVCVAAVSCQKESIVNQDSSETTNETNEIILPNGEVEYVIRERDSRHPFDDGSSVKDDDIQTKAVRDISRHVGETYKMENYPIACKENLGYLPVIDIDKYLKDHPGCYFDELNRISNTSCSVYTSFDEYEHSLENKTIIDASVGVGYSIFSAKAKDHYEKTFNTNEKTIKRSAYGEFFKQWLHRKYTLDINPDEIGNPDITKYLSKSFLDRIYKIPPKSFIQRYGSFILLKYYTGSQISIYYSGECDEDSVGTSEERKNSLSVAISASLKKEESDSLNIGLADSVENGSGSSHKSVFSNIKYWMTANGTAYGPAVLETAQQLGNIVFDFSSWRKSLSDTTGFDIIQLPDHSLLPLNIFIEEVNLRNILMNNIRGGLNDNRFTEPVINVFVDEYAIGVPSDSYFVEVELCSRYNIDENILMSRTIKKTELSNFIGELKAIFPYLKITSNKRIYNFEVELEVSRQQEGKDHIKTIVYVIGHDPVLVRDIIVPKSYVTDYLNYEEQRIRSRYNRSRNMPNVYVNDLDGDYPPSSKGRSLELIESKSEIIIDVDFPVLMDIEDEIRNKNTTIPSNLTKFIDDYTGKTYILDSSYHIAYVLYDKSIIKEYFSDAFIERLPESRFKSTEEIKQRYSLYAL